MSMYTKYANALSETVTQVRPAALKNMRCTLFNRSHAASLTLPNPLQHADSLVDALFSDTSTIAAGAVAQKYGGHQFGVWNPELGDGRGLLLGEVQQTDNDFIDLHLKGAGQTPYSRFADGRAVLRSTLREYIAGEALHAIGIPSSRSLCLLTSESQITREVSEPAAMMIRTAPSHIRFGHFEYYHHTDQHHVLDKLVDYTITEHFATCESSSNPQQALFAEIITRTAKLIALWQAYGFVHGVMNTDNMSIHGITFDYGPYAFQGPFKPNAVYNHSDHQGRYAFDQQPNIGLWNCYALAEGFSRYIDKETRQQLLDSYEGVLVSEYRITILKRMGLYENTSSIEDHWPLAMTFLQTVAKQSLDYNQAFVWLMDARVNTRPQLLTDNLIDSKALDHWWPEYLDASTNSYAQMKKVNPRVIPRTEHLEQLILHATKGEWEQVEQALFYYSQPYTQPTADNAWLARPSTQSSTTLSCSS